MAILREPADCCISIKFLFWIRCESEYPKYYIVHYRSLKQTDLSPKQKAAVPHTHSIIPVSYSQEASLFKQELEWANLGGRWVLKGRLRVAAAVPEHGCAPPSYIYCHVGPGRLPLRAAAMDATKMTLGCICIGKHIFEWSKISQ